MTRYWIWRTADQLNRWVRTARFVMARTDAEAQARMMLMVRSHALHSMQLVALADEVTIEEKKP